MMQTHREIFIKVIGVTIIIGIIFFIPFDCKVIKDICLALFGSAVIATFLEFVNYLSAKRQLIMHILADNSYISNAITDSVWFYNNCGDYVKKLDELIILYKAIQGYSCCLTRESYTPILKRDSMIKILQKNVDALAGIYDLSLKIQRTIVSFRNVRTNFIFEGEIQNNIEQIMDKQPDELIKDDVKQLKDYEYIILECSNRYKEKYKLNNINKVKDHYETLEKVIVKVEEQGEKYE